jgi:4,5-DOPA dioxygenase extradiol
MMAAIFVNHGGGPLPLLNDGSHKSLIRHLNTVSSAFPRPKAILVASAHWEESIPTFVAAADPGLLYDYYGFPQESYEISYPARNPTDLVRLARKLLASVNIKSNVDYTRKYDHGVFVPLKLMYPKADIPVMQVSLPSSRDPAYVYSLGKALAPLRKEGVLILGSGLSYHNLPSFFSSSKEKTDRSIAFDKDLQEAMLYPNRRELLLNWDRFSFARFCHPNEDHLMPLIFVAGAADGERCKLVYEDTLMGAKISGFQFGPGHDDNHPGREDL